MKNKKSWILLILDAVFIFLNYIIALWLRFDGNIHPAYIERVQNLIIFIIAIKLITYIGCKLYKIIWEYATGREIVNIVLAAGIGNIIATIYLTLANSGLPRSIYPIVLILDAIAISLPRLLPRIKSNISLVNPDKIYKDTLIVGAGEAGRLVLKELDSHREMGYRVQAFVDDDLGKIGKTIGGVEVKGNRYDIPRIAKDYHIEEIILAIPSASDKDRQEIIEICSEVSAKVKIVPGVYEMIEDGIMDLRDIRDLEIEDLLGREEVDLDISEMESMLKNRVVLITGGGGTIGSEISRQVAKYEPSQLILLDIYENTTYEIQNELRRAYPALDLVVLIDSIRDRDRISDILESYKPNIIFHAAAHKHVPLMEASPQSAVKNNVFGTLNLVLEADEHGVEKLVQISTDKAVNPTNVMGCTKRICEMIVQSFDAVSDTSYVSVRFGNVLGSNGSVIPLFMRQIKEGGPITVTHPDIIRYFMSIPEASQLVLQAGAIAAGGEVFVLDMGEPVKILDLAEKLIRLNGYEPYKDIDIEFVGLRPGEKLYEELLVSDDNDEIYKTDSERIYVEKPVYLEFHDLEQKLIPLLDAAQGTDRDAIIKELENIVPTFKNYVPAED